jgi:hypothetical protein
MLDKPCGVIKKHKSLGLLASLSVAVMLTGTVHAAELKILDIKGDAYVIVDAPSGSTFSVEAVTTIDSKGVLTLKGSDSAFTTSREVSHGAASSGAVFEGLEPGTYTLVPDASGTVVTRVDVISSSQVLGTGMEDNTAAASDTSTIGKSAYSAGAAAVAGAVAVAASGGASSIVSSGSGSSAASTARVGGLAGATGGSVGGGVTQPIVMIQPRATSFDPGRPASIPPPIQAPAVIPTPASAPPPSSSLPESPASQPEGQPSVMPPPPSKDPMTPS